MRVYACACKHSKQEKEVNYVHAQATKATWSISSRNQCNKLHTCVRMWVFVSCTF